MNGMAFGDFASACIERSRVSRHNCKLSGMFTVELWRGKEIVAVRKAQNAIVNVGLDHALDVIFRSVAQINPWNIGLINHAPVPTFAPADTMASNNFTEFIGYTEPTREDWNEDAASGQSITNSTAASFTINAGATLNGIFLVQSNVKNEVASLLWSTASFTSTLPVESLDVVKITYTVNAV